MSDNLRDFNQKVAEKFSPNWPMNRFGVIFRPSDERNGTTPQGVPLSVSEHYGVIPRDNAAGGQQASEDVSNYRVVRPGQLAANMMWLNKGGLGVSAHLGYISPAYMAFDISKDVDARFAHYLLRSLIYVEAFAALGTGVRPNSQMVNSIDLNGLPFPVPSSETQRRVADYLDRETAQIDETITRIDTVIDLLEERRARTHRDAFSDDDQTTSLVTISEITLGKMLDEKNTVGEPTEYLRAANVRADGSIDLEDTKKMLMTEDERERYELRAGDILMVEGGDAGRVALLHNDLPGLAIQKTLMRIRVNKTIADPAYCYWWIDHLHKSGVLALDYSVSTIAHFTAEKAQRIRVPLPPLEKQRKTAKYLQSQNAETNEMIKQAARVKELLQERRSALITAAVTGKIEI